MVASNKYICPGCITLRRDAGPVCEVCGKDYILLKKLYGHIIKRRPHLMELTPPQMFAKLWGVFLANNDGSAEELEDARGLYEEFMRK